MTQKDMISILINANSTLGNIRMSIKDKSTLDAKGTRMLEEEIKKAQERLVDEIVHCSSNK